MTKHPTEDELVAKYADEMNGLLLAAFHEQLKGPDFSNNGRFMVAQMRRGRDLLRRIVRDALPKEPIPVKPEPAKTPTNGPAPTPTKR